MTDFYDALGITPNASESEIKKAYRKLSLEYHPDKNSSPDASSKFQKINEAYETLSDPDKRRMYNMTGGTGLGGSGPMPFPFPFGPMGGGGSRSNIHVHTSRGGGGIPPDMNHIFEQFFGSIGEEFMMSTNGGPNIRIFQGGRPSPQPKPKPRPIPRPIPAVEKKIDITLEQAFTGFSLELETDMNQEKIQVQVSPGIEHDEIMILPNKGLVQNDSRGDVHLLFSIAKHPVFERKGLDLHCKQTISLKESLCGFTLMITHLNGKMIRLSNQKQSIVHPGFQRELNQFGMVRNNQVGKMVITFDVKFPLTLTVEQKIKLEAVFDEAEPSSSSTAASAASAASNEDSPNEEQKN